jgi:putative transposase
MFDSPPPGFVGLNPIAPVTIHRRHLPHWRQTGATYFVTFRLADSLPAGKLSELRADRECWLKGCPEPSDEQFEAHMLEHMKKGEKWLDQGYGGCVLKQDGVSEMVEGCLRYFEGERYRLFSAVIMSNHIHICVRPLGKWGLDHILKGWKSVSSRNIGRSLGTRGELWQQESFDRIVRDTGHLRKVVTYIEANPEKAGVSARCWTTVEWDLWMGRGGTDR